MYIIVSLMMFFEYAVWGAWMPVLAGRLLGPLKLSGNKTGWVYATLPLGCMIATPIAGHLADTMVDAKWILVACHAVGAVLLYIAAKQKSFIGIFFAMFFYSLCYAATIPLVNAIMFAHLGEINVDQGRIFIWAPVAWATIGYILSGYRATRKVEGDQSDGLKLAALCSIIMVVICCFQPDTPPSGAKEGGGMLAALGLMKDPSFAIFMIVTLGVAGLQQFYFLGSAQMIQDIGMSVKSVPGVMAIAQVVQALATWFLLSLLLDKFQFQYTLTFGVLCWAALFAVYSFLRVPIFVVPIQAFHGLAYVFFIIVGQIYCNEVADEAMRSSAQALVIFVQAGLALFLATQLAGFTMSLNTNKETGKFNWTKIFMVPLVITVLGAALLLIGMKDPPKAEEKPKDPAGVVNTDANGDAETGNKEKTPEATTPTTDTPSEEEKIKTVDEEVTAEEIITVDEENPEGPEKKDESGDTGE
jgi:MFS family permease